MIPAAQRYRDLFLDLARRRKLSNGELSLAQEAQSAADLDRCWNAMTRQEHEAIEQWLATQSPSVAP